jgi:molybdopterin-guanine dinucleotide biosynthesis protein A
VSAALAAVLAGGRSRRMGRPKAGVPLGGRPLAAWVLDAAAAAGVDAVVVAKPGFALPGAEVWEEPAAPSHPLTGLVRALEAGRPVIALACDMPFVPPSLIARLAGMDGTVVVRVGGAVQPFPGRYEPGSLVALRAALEREGPVLEAVAALDPVQLADDELREHGDPARIVTGINTPEELAAAEAALRG